MSFEFDQMVSSLIKPGQEIMERVTPLDLELAHTCLGLSGEVGELVDAIKKHIIYHRDLDILNVIEELGDIEFYLSDLRSKLNIDREFILQKNMDKLSKRYPNKTYSDAAANERADKK